VARALWTDYREWIATLSLGFAALALGYIGFAKYFDATGETRSHLDIMYLAWQLFTLESGGVSGTVPTELEIARVLAPLATASAALSVLLLFLREQARKLKLVFVHNHVIVCGLGRTGVQIVEECLCEGLRVVAVEEDGECGTLDYCRELGAIVVVGDATKGTVLLAARADCARALVAICGNDGANIQIAMTANDIVRERARSASKGELLYYVQVMNYSMATLFKEHPLLTDSSDYHSVHFFNAYENAVRQLFHSRPIDREPIVPEDGRQAHLIVLGIGQMGESVIVQALKLAHFANGIPLKITALDRIATRREKSLAVRHANLEKVCDIAFEDVEFDNSETLDRIKALASGDSTLTSIVICSDDDARSVLWQPGRENCQDPGQ